MIVFIQSWLISCVWCWVKIKEGDVILSRYSVLLLMIPLFFIEYPFSALVDCLFALLILLQRRKHVLYGYLVVPMLVVSFINGPSSFYKPKKSRKNVSQLVRRNKIHTVADLTTRQNVNQTFYLFKRVSGYTSTNNKHYNKFLFDTLRILFLQITVSHRMTQTIFSTLRHLVLIQLFLKEMPLMVIL